MHGFCKRDTRAWMFGPPRLLRSSRHTQVGRGGCRRRRSARYHQQKATGEARLGKPAIQGSERRLFTYFPRTQFLKSDSPDRPPTPYTLAQAARVHHSSSKTQSAPRRKPSRQARKVPQSWWAYPDKGSRYWDCCYILLL